MQNFVAISLSVFELYAKNFGILVFFGDTKAVTQLIYTKH